MISATVRKSRYFNRDAASTTSLGAGGSSRWIKWRTGIVEMT